MERLIVLSFRGLMAPLLVHADVQDSSALLRSVPYVLYGGVAFPSESEMGSSN